MTQPKIVQLSEKKLVGQRMCMSLANNQTGMLWKQFMPLRNQIQNRVTSDLFSLTLHHTIFDFEPQTEFDKWAAAEVTTFENVPEGMETLVIPAGTYAVFNYKGLSSDPSIFRYIFGTWLPASEWKWDHRPRFEILGSKYKNNNPDSEEEIWIPVAKK